ncbi:peptidase s45 penicillin amidase [Anaeramoeba flamelloides]|uniref:Peptidase s45 penicillin amidase n=1 Tax=Anaeramoeba flamelloides TaxID=1746091 RepID=A0AAV7YNB5_9EUKA|nr:peptidase s45 penicillin amidase [Anaeramoeba flamelloides]
MGDLFEQLAQILLFLAFLVAIYFVIYSLKRMFEKKYFVRLCKGSLATLKGNFFLQSGPRQSFQITRDSEGVPHLIGETNQDIFFGMGFVHSQDRLFQLEMSRRIATGQLTEILGNKENLLSCDLFFRSFLHLGNAQKEWEHLPEQHQKLIQSYVNGINSCIKRRRLKGSLPMEFKLLKFEPKIWTVYDVLILTKCFVFQNNSILFEKLLICELLQKKNISQEMMRELFNLKNVTNNENTNHNEEIEVEIEKEEEEEEEEEEIEKKKEKKEEKQQQEEKEKIKNFLSNLNLNFKTIRQQLQSLKIPFMNNSVFKSKGVLISGKHTFNNSPLMYSEIFSNSKIPTSFYELHLNCQKNNLNYYGFTIPGVFYFPMGQNGKVSFCLNIEQSDNLQLFIEKRISNNVTKGHESCDIGIIKESFHIKGGKTPLQYESLKTPNGISLFYNNNQKNKSKLDAKEILVYNSIIHNTEFITFMINLLFADHLNSIEEILKNQPNNFLNLVAVDNKGNIGKYSNGNLFSNNLINNLILPGWQTKKNRNCPPKKTNFYKFKKNPKSGIIINQTNNLCKESLKHYAYLYEDQMHDQENKINQEKFEELINHNLISYQGTQLIKILKQNYNDWFTNNKNPKVKLFWEKFKNWDGLLKNNSFGATIYPLFTKKLLEFVFIQYIDFDFFNLIFNNLININISQNSLFQNIQYRFLNQLIKNIQNTNWLTDEKLLHSFFENSIKFIDKEFKKIFNQIHNNKKKVNNFTNFQLNHPISFISNILPGIYHTKKITHNTLFQNNFQYNYLYFPNTKICTQIKSFFDLQDCSKSKMILNTGNSENPYSAYYDNGWNNLIKNNMHQTIWFSNQLKFFQNSQIVFKIMEIVKSKNHRKNK